MSEFPTYHFENKPKVLGGIALILFGVVGFDGFGLDDNCCITFGHGSAFGSDGAGYIARGESQSHSDGGSNGHDEDWGVN